MTDLDIGIEAGDAVVAFFKAMTDKPSPVRGTVYLQLMLIILKIVTFVSPDSDAIAAGWSTLMSSSFYLSNIMAPIISEPMPWQLNQPFCAFVV